MSKLSLANNRATWMSMCSEFYVSSVLEIKKLTRGVTIEVTNQENAHRFFKV
ncbi:hypothetical protein ACP70R_045763 [Stipagrostis hirtigluma subsp. patula]